MNTVSYSNATQQLEAIIDKLENEDISLDELSKEIKTAAKLIKFCQQKLQVTENEVNEILTELEKDNNTEENNKKQNNKK